jgi:acetyl esterase/lipase
MKRKRFKTSLIAILIMVLNSTFTMGQFQPLYSTIPNNKEHVNKETSTTEPGILIIEKVSIPAFQYYRYRNDDIKRPCIIICPGGGYGVLAAGHEGSDLANYFNELGINALVLKYRIPNSENQIDKSIAPLQDVQQAMYLCRLNAAAWGIDPTKIGIMGFSAGGHLAASLATHYEDLKINNPENISLRPDFQILIYPVISFNSFGHAGSRNNLIGPVISEDDIHYFSNETHINKQSPPAFLVHAKDDSAVPVANSTIYYKELLINKVPAEIYLYEKGGHGFGMKNSTSEIYWPSLLKQWMQKNKIID